MTGKSRVRALIRLSAVKVAKLKQPGLYEDGGGLRLVVTDTGSTRRTLRVTINGRRVERGLGVWPTVSLEDARRKAEHYRRAAREGRDARADDKQHRPAPKFRDAFDAFFEIRRQHLSNGKHAQQWQNTMRDYVFPKIADRPVAEITAAEVIDVLRPIWFSKPETASCLLQRMKATFDSAILRGMRERANPCTGIGRELGTRHHHHPALHWSAVPSFVRTLHQWRAEPATRLLFEFLILTVARSGEARGALWSEIDLAGRSWTIPGEDQSTGRRMKTGVAHVVPLSDRAMAILEEARALHDGELIFPSKRGQAFSDNTLSKLMRDAAIPGTPHGFRSAFKDWAAEHGVRDEVSEAALAHVDKNKVRAAYRRTQFFAERVDLMRAWTDFVTNASN